MSELQRYQDAFATIEKALDEHLSTQGSELEIESGGSWVNVRNFLTVSLGAPQPEPIDQAIDTLKQMQGQWKVSLDDLIEIRGNTVRRIRDRRHLTVELTKKVPHPHTEKLRVMLNDQVRYLEEFCEQITLFLVTFYDREDMLFLDSDVMKVVNKYRLL